jgi:hypothetical protein
MKGGRGLRGQSGMCSAEKRGGTQGGTAWAAVHYLSDCCNAMLLVQSAAPAVAAQTYSCIQCFLLLQPTRLQRCVFCCCDQLLLRRRQGDGGPSGDGKGGTAVAQVLLPLGGQGPLQPAPAALAAAALFAGMGALVKTLVPQQLHPAGLLLPLLPPAAAPPAPAIAAAALHRPFMGSTCSWLMRCMFACRRCLLPITCCSPSPPPSPRCRCTPRR